MSIDRGRFAAAIAVNCDYIAASSGGVSPSQKIKAEPGYQIPLSADIRKRAAIPTMGVGLITHPQNAEEILKLNQADFIALGRQMLYEPRWAWRAAEELGHPSYCRSTAVCAQFFGATTSMIARRVPGPRTIRC